MYTIYHINNSMIDCMKLLQVDDELKVIFNFVEAFEKAYITTGELPDPKDIDPTIVVPKLGGHFTAQMSMDMIYKKQRKCVCSSRTNCK